MLKDITLGQYFPGNSLLHRLDPRMKLTLTMMIHSTNAPGAVQKLSFSIFMKLLQSISKHSFRILKSADLPLHMMKNGQKISFAVCRKIMCRLISFPGIFTVQSLCI